MKGEPVATIDEYISTVPEVMQGPLERLRALVKKVVPDAVERISYNVPTFLHHGHLVGFSVSQTQRRKKQFISFHVMSPKVMKAMKEELVGYETTTATLHIPIEKALPSAIIKRIVLARVEENDARARAKQK